MSVQGMQATIMLTQLAKALRRDGWTREVIVASRGQLEGSVCEMSDDPSRSPALVEFVRQTVEAMS